MQSPGYSVILCNIYDSTDVVWHASTGLL